MLHVYSDDNTDAPAETAADLRTTAMPGLTRMVDAIRELAHRRSGYVGVVIVPSLEHLSPARDRSQSIVAMLLGLHFGVSVQTAHATAGRVDPGATYGHEVAFAGGLLRVPEQPGDAWVSDDRDLTANLARKGWTRTPAQDRVDRVLRGLAFGELLHGIHGDPDRVPVWTPPRTPAGP